MKILVSLLVISAVLCLTAIAYPVNIVPIHPVGDSIDIAHTTTAHNPEQHISLSRFTAMVYGLVGALQFI